MERIWWSRTVVRCQLHWWSELSTRVKSSILFFKSHKSLMLRSGITKASVTDTRQSTSDCTGTAFIILSNGKMCTKLLASYIPWASLLLVQHVGWIDKAKVAWKEFVILCYSVGRSVGCSQHILNLKTWLPHVFLIALNLGQFI